MGTEGENRVLPLDGLRGAAALVIAVVFHYRHFYEYGVQPDPAWFRGTLSGLVVAHGAYAVDLFFIISGFIFTQVYQEAVSLGRVSGRQFFVFRFARLYPLHLVATLIVGALIWLSILTLGHLPLPYLGASDGYHLMLNLLMIQNIGLQFGLSFNFASWSLSEEVICYCIFFLVARYSKTFELCCAALAIFGIFLLFNRINTVLLDSNFGRALFGFFAGSLIARAFAAGLSRPLAIAAAGASVYTLLIMVAGEAVMPGQANPFLTLQTVLLPSLLILALTLPPLRMLLSCWVARKIGELSYGIYMVHITVQCIFIIVAGWTGTKIPYDRWWFYLLYVSCVIGLAEIAHRAVERPAQRWLRQRFAPRTTTSQYKDAVSPEPNVMDGHTGETGRHIAAVDSLA